MNKLSYVKIILSLSFVTLVSCAHKDGLSESDGGDVLLTLVTQSECRTRTFLTEGQENKYPVYWSDGDVVSVNGVHSSPLKVEDGAKISKAEFQVRNVAPPFQVVYPASAFGEMMEDGRVRLIISDSQDFCPGSFGCGSAILYGEGGPSNSSVSLKNLCGAICVSLKDEGAVIKNVTLTSLGSKSITGEFALNMTTGAMDEIDGGKSVSLALPEGGVALDPAGTKFFFTIPSGDYPDGFCLRFDGADKRAQKSFWIRQAKGSDPGVSVNPHEIVFFEAMPYSPDAREILSGEDWAEFIQAYENGTWEEDWKSKDGTIKLGGDILLDDLSSISDFSDVFDGQGHTIKVNAGTGALASTLSGTIRNLTIEGNTSAESVFAEDIVSGAIIENCTNGTTISISEISDDAFVAPFASRMSGGTISNCTNNGSISLNANLDKTYKIAAGGFVAVIQNLSSNAKIEKCTNAARISLTIVKPSGAGATYPSICGTGGIAGAVLAGTETNYLLIDKCTNNADVSVDYTYKDNSVAAAASGVGGILGVGATYDKDYKSLSLSDKSHSCIYLEITGCTSNGTIFNGCCSAISSFLPGKAYAGGLAGIVAGLSSKHIVIKNSNVAGKIYGHTGNYSRSALSTVTGGLAGYAGYADFSGCCVNNAVIGSVARQSYSCGGAIGLAMTTFKMNDCKVFATVNYIRNYVSSSDPDKEKGNYAIGFVLSTKTEGCAGMRASYVELTGSEIKNCKFGGEIVYSSDIIAYNSATPSSMQTLTLSESNYNDNIASASLSVDGETYRSVSLSDNGYWNGK